MDWLCWRCEHTLFKRVSFKKRQISDQIFHHYLIDWDPGDLWISHLVRSLKGGGPLQIYSHLVAHFDLSLIEQQAQGPLALVYPSQRKNDHAFELARAIHLKTAIPMVPLLKVGQRKQALLSREQRRSVVFRNTDQNPRFVILMDDIVTTGSTAMAAYKACNQPEKFTVWSLFYRKSLRSTRPFAMVRK